MTFWIIAALLAALVTALLARGLLAPAEPGSDRRGHDLSVYRDQLGEVDRDRERGLISDQDAVAARLEIERRILALGLATDPADHDSRAPAGARWKAAVVAILVPVASLSLYLWLGSPGTESQPFAERPASEGEGGGDFATITAQLRDRVAQNPKDDEAWLLLGHMERRVGNAQAAQAAYKVALEANPDNNNARISLAESLIGAAEGIVERDARLLFAEVLRRDPTNASARYYAGLAMVQDGQGARALEVWLGLLRDSSPTAPWIPLVRRQITELARSLELDPAVVLEGTGPEGAPDSVGPGADDVAAAAAMSEEERAAFIRSMVSRLAERLSEDPDDLKGWLQLARSYGVLGETEKARDALEKARTLVADLPEDAAQRTAVRALAERLGLQP